MVPYLQPEIYGNGKAQSGYSAGVIKGPSKSAHFSPLGALITELYAELSWEHSDLREMTDYFRQLGVSGSGEAKIRLWEMDIYSDLVRKRIEQRGVENGVKYSDWAIFY